MHIVAETDNEDNVASWTCMRGAAVHSFSRSATALLDVPLTDGGCPAAMRVMNPGPSPAAIPSA